ncbi:MAG TPA: helix-turn-helix domain-containing protein [Candidatus Dormibacteraeota bacterium]|nr:helix-turn-helix domain-containing protein [Candidatus Dormibacteraeota bacterium]
MEKRVEGMGDRLKRQRPSGVLDLEAGRRWFDTAQYGPAPELTELVEHYWRVRWDVRGRQPYEQHTLSNASVHLCAERGNSRIQGVVTGRFTRLLEGEGRVFGVKFRPAGFRPFLSSPVSALADRTLPVAAVFGPAGDALVDEILALDDAGGVDAADAFLRRRLPPADPAVAEVNGIATLIVADRSITRVDHVVERTGLGKRMLQRLFSEYVGVSPKWLIQRYRLHEAADRLANDPGITLAALALDLGYFDQAHFVRDFKAIVGRPPAAYARGARSGSAT